MSPIRPKIQQKNSKVMIERTTQLGGLISTKTRLSTGLACVTITVLLCPCCPPQPQPYPCWGGGAERERGAQCSVVQLQYGLLNQTDLTGLVGRRRSSRSSNQRLLVRHSERNQSIRAKERTDDHKQVRKYRQGSAINSACAKRCATPTCDNMIAL